MLCKGLVDVCLCSNNCLRLVCQAILCPFYVFFAAGYCVCAPDDMKDTENGSGADVRCMVQTMEAQVKDIARFRREVQHIEGRHNRIHARLFGRVHLG